MVGAHKRSQTPLAHQENLYGLGFKDSEDSKDSEF